MADGDERRSTRQRGAVSYKEPGELKISMLEGKAAKKKEEPDNDSSDEEEDFSRGAKPKARKQRRVSGGHAASPAPRAQGSKPARHSIDGSESLLEIIIHKPSAIAMTVKQWWSDYDKNPSAAVAKLTNMMIEACGLPNRLPPVAFSDDDDKDVDDYISELVESCTSKNDDGNVSGGMFDKKDKKSEKIQKNFSDFWSKFVSFAPEADMRMLHEHPFCPWLHAMSTSQLKVMRQAATTAGLDMMVGVVERTKDTLDSMSNIERLYEAASKKKDERDMERYKEQLDSKREIRKDNETCIVSFFNSIFIHRYKDAHAEVRAKCTEAVGKVIMDYSSKFLDNMYLKYIGWALYDKSPEVRLVALDAVDTFYKSQLVNNLEAFTSRFRARVMQMSMDIDKEVQVRAIQTAESMAIQDLLSDQAGLNFREQIYQMITEEDEDLRSASATFIKASYIDLDLEPEYKKLSKKFGKSVPARDVYMLKGIVELLNVVAAQCDDMHYIMDSLMQECEFLHDLGLMCDVMMEEEGEDTLDDEQRATLGKILLGVVATLSERAEPDESGQRLGKKKNPNVEKCRQATLVLGEKLPNMLKYFSANPAALTALVGTIEHMNLDAFNAKDSSSKQIAEAIVDFVKKDVDQELLESCAIALEHFSSHDYAARPTVEALVKNLFKSLATDLKKVAEAFEKKSKITAAHTYTLKRLMLLAGHCDVFKSEQSIRTYVVKMLTAIAEEESAVPPDIAAQTILLVSQCLVWSVQTSSFDDRVNETKEQLVGCCNALFERSDLSPHLRAQASAALADCQHIFGRFSKEARPANLEVTKLDVEELLASSDSILSRGAHAFALDGEIKTVNRCFSESEDDKYGNMRATSVNLLKVVSYGEIDTLSEDFVCDMLSCLTLHRPYPNSFHKEMLKTMHDSMERYEDQVSLWKTAHTRMFDRIQQELSSTASRKKTDEMTACLMSSVGQLKLKNQAEVREYILGGLEWVFEDWQGMRKAFTEGITVMVKKLERNNVASILSAFDKLCSKYDVPINSHDEGERSVLSVLINFRNFLDDRSNGVSQGHGRPKGAATPAAKARATPATKARLTFTPSGTPASSQPSGGKASSRGGSSSKRKARAIGSEDEDDDGWVAAPSQVGSMASSSSDGKRSRK